MRANLRVALAARCAASILVPLALSVADSTAAILNVATTAELQSAIANAQAGDTVVLAAGLYQPSARLVVGVDLTIQGDLSAPSILDGNGADILLVVARNVRIENLTFRNGRTAIALGGGQGANLLISGTTITSNTRLGIGTGDGGGHVTVVNSTIAGNINGEGPQEPATGLSSACSSFTLRHVTVSDNDRGLFIGSCSDDTVSIQNALIVGNRQDCRVRNGFTFAGHTSFDSDGTCRTGIEGGSSVFSTVPDPGLGPLADNGGPTLTMALSALSPAVGAGTSCAEVFDQRGAARDTACDAGAFERAATVRMASTSGAGPVDFSTNVGTFLTFHPVAEADMPNQAGKPRGVNFPYGFFEWSAGTLILAGGTANITVTFPSTIATRPQYWKVINGVWTDICLLVPCAVNGNHLTISYQDGGIADLDGMANAVIVDPGGLGVGGETVDVTSPQIQCASPDGLWHATDVSLACGATDSESGLTDAADVSFLLSTAVGPGVETENATTGSRQVCDGMGNCATAGPIGSNRVDTKGPSVALRLPSQGATYQVGEAVRADYSCSDAGSGVNGCAGPVSSGASIDTSAVGPKTFTVQAIDNVGNPGATSVTYQVGCDYVSLGLSPSTVVASNAVRITTGLRTCSTTAQTIVLRFTFTGAGRPHGCGAVKTTMLTTPPIALPAGFNRSVSFSYRVPAGTCPGEYSVSVATLMGGATVDTASATLTVVR